LGAQPCISALEENQESSFRSLYTNTSIAARIDYYYDQINEIIQLPEPTGSLGWGVGLLLLLARRRAASLTISPAGSRLQAAALEQGASGIRGRAERRPGLRWRRCEAHGRPALGHGSASL
jgi:hypothetical protein